MRAGKLNTLITEKGYKTIEVHPTSTRKARDWSKVQSILKSIGLKGNLEVRALTHHEIEALTATLTAHLCLRDQTESLGNNQEGCIVIPKKQDWRTLKI
jgi:predicted nuclease with RNAse H fold